MVISNFTRPDQDQMLMSTGLVQLLTASSFPGAIEQGSPLQSGYWILIRLKRSATLVRQFSDFIPDTISARLPMLAELIVVPC